MLSTLKRYSAFTLLEVLIVVIIIGILAALVIPQVSGAAEDAKVTKILQVVDTARTAVEAHYAHTGKTAREYSDSNSETDHQLSIKQQRLNWKGPYLTHPLTTSDNPYGGTVRIYEDLEKGKVNPSGFDLIGRGTVTSEKSGQYIAFTQIDEVVAKEVNDVLDRGLSGKWQSTGRVEWSKNTLMIFLMDTND